MWLLWNKTYSLVSDNCHPIHPFVWIFLKFIILPPANRFLKVFRCYVLSLYEKERYFFLFHCVLPFLTGLLLSIRYKQLLHIFQLSTVLDCPFDWFSTICQKIWWLFLSTLIFDVPVISNRPFTTVPLVIEFKPNSFPYTHDYPNTMFFDFQERVFSSRIFDKTFQIKCN